VKKKIKLKSFNSSVGILSVGTQKEMFGRLEELEVSIPQSEFCPLGRKTGKPTGKDAISFNSSVGILSVGTNFTLEIRIKAGQFQFLSRNSVRWDRLARGHSR